jgi:hypothetical protein
MGEAKMAALFKTYFQQFNTDQNGNVFLTGPVNVGEYAKASLEILQHPTHEPNMTVHVVMGKISGSTLAAELEVFPLDAPAKIHTYDVVGPELSVLLQGGPPNTAISIQAWLFLR